MNDLETALESCALSEGAQDCAVVLEVPASAELSDYLSSSDETSRSTHPDLEDEASLGELVASPRPADRRSISFHDSVEIREYSLTFGDHPSCSDSLPLSLDWAYSEEPHFRSIDRSKERDGKYSRPSRLSQDERKQRVYTTSPRNMQQIKEDEMASAVGSLDVIKMKQLIKAPTLVEYEDIFEDLEKDEPIFEEEKECVEAPKPLPGTMEWRRNSFRRQIAFSD